jgi:hypothetical protein
MSFEVLNKFKEYHQKNPHIWNAFEKFACIASQHRNKFSARAIFEQIRWETMVSGDGDFKVWDHASPYYARMFEEKYPQFEGFFRKKDILPEGFSVTNYLEQ